ncbi:glycosyl hydrolase 53 family protein [Bacillus sp. SL00103]
MLKAGTNAVRSVDSNINIMLHLAHGGDNGASRWWFDEITKRGCLIRYDRFYLTTRIGTGDLAVLLTI